MAYIALAIQPHLWLYILRLLQRLALDIIDYGEVIHKGLLILTMFALKQKEGGNNEILCYSNSAQQGR